MVGFRKLGQHSNPPTVSQVFQLCTTISCGTTFRASCRVAQHEYYRVTTQEHFADVAVLVYRLRLLLPLPRLGLLCPHLLHVGQHPAEKRRAGHTGGRSDRGPSFCAFVLRCMPQYMARRIQPSLPSLAVTSNFECPPRRRSRFDEHHARNKIRKERFELSSQRKKVARMSCQLNPVRATGVRKSTAFLTTQAW